MEKKTRCKLGLHRWDAKTSRQKTCIDCGKTSSLPSFSSFFQSTYDSDGKKRSSGSDGVFGDGGGGGGE